MAFRIRQRATGEIEVEMDTASEVQTLLEVVRAQRGFALPLLAAPPGAEASPNGHRPRRAVRAVGRRRRRQAVEAPPRFARRCRRRGAPEIARPWAVSARRTRARAPATPTQGDGRVEAIGAGASCALDWRHDRLPLAPRARSGGAGVRCAEEGALTCPRRRSTSCGMERLGSGLHQAR